MAKNKKKIKRTTFLVSIPVWVLDKAKEKADIIPLSRIITRLLEKWINDEIDLD